MRPERPPMFDPKDERYWDPRDLEQELERVFSICHGCRMCVGFCPSFPSLFDRVDGYVNRGTGEIDAFIDQDYEAVNDLCYQCKLCYFKCPYTPDDDHPFALDFPRLMLRHRAQRARRDGVTLQDQALGEPQLLGRLATLAPAGMANLVTKNRLLRKAQEAVTGISADFNLPPFASKTLYKWWREHTPAPQAGSAGQVVLFSTCTTNYNLPSAGQAAVQVLEHNGLMVIFPRDQTCCGMPNLDGGDVDAATDKAQLNVAVLHPYAAQGIPIVVLQPTCGYVLKKDYPELLGTPEARAVSAQTLDLLEFVRKLQREKKLSMDFKRSLGRIGYHAPCHLRAQKIGFPAAQILSKVPETEVETIQECSAVDGTWGMKAQHFELGRKYAQKLIRGLQAAPYDLVTTDCPLSGLRIEQETARATPHPIELLNDAYGLAPVRPGPTLGHPLDGPPPMAEGAHHAQS
ncbi:MAG: 4Fe-4S dicluster domain-containing protein [Myxococcales bacterium]|nr:4Fe-4S dicluster domain-containing protein [Myxococcales bacterium]